MKHLEFSLPEKDEGIVIIGKPVSPAANKYIDGESVGKRLYDILVQSKDFPYGTYEEIQHQVIKDLLYKTCNLETLERLGKAIDFSPLDYWEGRVFYQYINEVIKIKKSEEENKNIKPNTGVKQ